MLTLDSTLRIPETSLSTTVDGEVVLLNARMNQYFALDDAGARIWTLLGGGNSLRAIHKQLLAEYQVDGAVMEQDMLELVRNLLENGLVELVGQ
jgi:hypothetical protein